MLPRKAKTKIERERERESLNLSIRDAGMEAVGRWRGRERKEESKRWRKSMDKELCM